MLLGTHWFCGRCGNEYKRPVVSVDVVNELREALKEATEVVGRVADEYPFDEGYATLLAKLKKLC